MIKKYEWLIIAGFILIIWGCIFYFSEIFKSGFNYFLDDHQILLCHGQYTTLKQIVVEPFVSAFTPHADYRFRPLYMVFLRFFSEVYGLNPFVWYASSFFIAVITTMAFYFIGRQMSLSIWESALFSLLILFGNQASTYSRFGTPETTSTLLIALALVCASINSKSKIVQGILDVLFVGFAILAAMNKEACILILPALACFKVWIYVQQNDANFRVTLNKYKYHVAFLLAVCCFLVGYIYLTGVSGPGYAGISKKMFSLAAIKNILKILTKKTSLILALVINAGYLWTLYREHRWKNFGFIGFYLIVILIIFPQLILYSKSGIDNHYLFPVVIGIAFLTVFPLMKIKLNYLFAYKITMLLIALIIVQHIYTTYHYFHAVALTTSEIRVFVKDVSYWAGQKDQIVVFGNPYFHFERLFGFKTITNKLINNHNVFLVAYGSSQAVLVTDVFKNEENNLGFLDPNTVTNWYENKMYKDIKWNTLENTVIVVMSYTKIQNDLNRLILNEYDPDFFVRKDYRYNDISVFYRKQ